jgi:hypothetical protein
VPASASDTAIEGKTALTDTPATADELALLADPAIQTKVLELLKQLAGMTTIKDEFEALPKNSEGWAIKDDTLYPDADELRANMSDDRLLGEVETLEWVIENARDVVNAMAPSLDSEVGAGGHVPR